MQKLKMPLLGSVLFQHITVSLPVLNVWQSHQYKNPNEFMIRKTNTLGFSCEKLEAFNQQKLWR